MSRGMGSDFVMIEGEGILRVRNKKNRLREGKIKVWMEGKRKKKKENKER